MDCGKKVHSPLNEFKLHSLVNNLTKHIHFRFCQITTRRITIPHDMSKNSISVKSNLSDVDCVTVSEVFVVVVGVYGAFQT